MIPKKGNKMKQTLRKQAFEIGHREAEKHNSLIVPAQSKEMMDFLSEHIETFNDSVFLLDAFNDGQSKWLENDVKRTFPETN